MTKIKLISSVLLSAVASLLFFTSCNNDDGYSLGNYTMTYATTRNLQNAENQNTGGFYLEVDNEKWWIAAPLNVGTPKKDQQRSLVNVTLLSDEYGDFDHMVRLNNILFIDTRDVSVLKEGDEDSYGKDQFVLLTGDAFITNGIGLNNYFLDVICGKLISGSNTKHSIALVENKNKQYNDDYAHLELRYNAQGDNGDKYAPYRVSFNVSKYIDETKNGLKIHRINIKGEEEVMAFDFSKPTDDK